MWIKLIMPGARMRPMDSLWKTHMSPPLPLLVVGALTPAEHRVTLENENVEKLHLDDAPDLVGISVTCDTFDRAAEIADVYRARGTLVVMGGIHPTACPEMCEKSADAVVIGPAEPVWGQILADIIAGTLKHRYHASSAQDLSSTPVPRWGLINEGDYLFTNTMCIGRGCPWKCDFCYNSAENVDAGYQRKPLANILAEIEALGTRHVMFTDDNFIGSPDRTRELLRTMHGMDLTWHCAVSTDIGRHEDILDQMAETGCKSLFIGFETIRLDGLTSCHKYQNRVEEYDQTIRKIHERGMMVNASMVFGFDTDTPDVFVSTFEWLKRNRIETLTSHILTPYPGTKLHARLQVEGRIVDRNLRNYDTAHVVFEPAGMTAEDLYSGYLGMYRKFYSWRSIFDRMPQDHSQAIAYLQFSLFYRKFGKLTSRAGHLIGMRRLARFAKWLAYGGARVQQNVNITVKWTGWSPARVSSDAHRDDAARQHTCARGHLCESDILGHRS